MMICLKNNNTLCADDFQFRCSIGKYGLNKKKIEGDKCTPIGKFKLTGLFYRNDRIKNIKTKINKKIIKRNLGWCNESGHKLYNRPIKVDKNISHEKMFRSDNKYDLVIVLDYNLNKTVAGKGSAIFIHVTNNYLPTAGCIALNKKDLLILLKLITKDTYIKIN